MSKRKQLLNRALRNDIFGGDYSASNNAGDDEYAYVKRDLAMEQLVVNLFSRQKSTSANAKETLKLKAAQFLKTTFAISGQVKGYDGRKFLDDVLAALTCAFVLLPQAIAYAGLAQIPPIQALLSAIFPPMLYAFFGSSRHLAVGPEAMVSVVVGSAISSLMDKNPNAAYTAAQVASALAFVVGIMTLLLSFLRAGFIDNILSGYLLTGFVLGGASLIMVEQLPELMGLVHMERETNASTINMLIAAIKDFGDAKWLVMAISVSNISFLLFFSEIKKRFGKRWFWLSRTPEILILVIVMIVVSYAFQFQSRDINVLGSFDNHLLVPQPPPLSTELLRKLIEPAMTIVLNGFIECQTVTRDFGLKYGYFPSGDSELFSFGFMNLISSFFGSSPTFGSLPRSRILAQSGARTTFANAMAGGFVLVALLTLVPVLQYLPRATLASIVFVAALGLIDVKEIGFVFRLRAWSEIAMFLTTYVICLVTSITTGIVICLCLSALLIVRRTTMASMSVMGRVQYQTHDHVPERPNAPTPVPGFGGKNGRAKVGSNQPMLRHSPSMTSMSSNGGGTTNGDNSRSVTPMPPSEWSEFGGRSVVGGVFEDMEGLDGLIATNHHHASDSPRPPPGFTPEPIFGDLSSARLPTFTHQQQQQLQGHDNLSPRSSHMDMSKVSYVNVDEHPSAELLDGVILLRIEVPLLFYNAGQARRAIDALMQAEMQLARDRTLEARRRRRIRQASQSVAATGGPGTGGDGEEDSAGLKRPKRAALGGLTGESQGTLYDDLIALPSPTDPTAAGGEDVWGPKLKKKASAALSTTSTGSSSSSGVGAGAGVAPGKGKLSSVFAGIGAKVGIGGRSWRRMEDGPEEIPGKREGNERGLAEAIAASLGTDTNATAAGAAPPSVTVNVELQDVKKGKKKKKGSAWKRRATDGIESGPGLASMAGRGEGDEWDEDHHHMHEVELGGLSDEDLGEDDTDESLKVHTIVFDFKRCTDLDSAATFVIKKIFRTFISQGMRVCLVGLHEFQISLFQRAGMSEILDGNMFDTMVSAVADIEDTLEHEAAWHDHDDSDADDRTRDHSNYGSRYPPNGQSRHSISSN